MHTRRLLVMDACVLIDYVSVDRSILTLAAQHLGDIHVASPVLQEVKALNASLAGSLGLKLVEPPLEMVLAAGATRGRLSFQDRLCLLIAKAYGWTCVSNDRQLRTACTGEGIAVLWGLEILALLVSANALSAADAKEVAQQIASSNRRIGKDVVARFVAKIGAKE